MTATPTSSPGGGAPGVPLYRRGDAGAAVVEIRSVLCGLGLLGTPFDPAGFGPAGFGPAGSDAAEFDEAMDHAVRAFQQQRGISVDGIVGPTTYRLLDEARWRLGDRILVHAVSHPLHGDDVSALQRRLAELGFDCGRVDGAFGTRTEAALREFQRNVGLLVDGLCGPATFKELDRLARTVTGGRPYALREETAFTREGPLLSGKVVVLDPGHGGGDPGVVAHGLAEADLVADLAARIEGRLTATGVVAFPTRGGALLDERQRAAIANTAGAHLVISLHVDAHVDPQAQGVATYYYGNDRFGHGSAVGERLAELVQGELVARTGLTDCRTHGRTWDLLRFTRMPAVRIELGYLTNSGDAAQLREASFRDTVADAVVAAIGRVFLPAQPVAASATPPNGAPRLAELVRG